MKNLIKPLLIVMVATLTFSCSPEGTVEPVDNQAKFGRSNPFIGDEGQTPESTYVTAELSNDISSTFVACNRTVSNYAVQELKVMRGLLTSNPTSDPSINPELEVKVSVNQYLEDDAIWVSWGTKVLTIPQDSLRSDSINMPILISDQDLLTANFDGFGGSAMILEKDMQIKVSSIRAVTGADTSYYYPLNTSFTAGCPN